MIYITAGRLGKQEKRPEDDPRKDKADEERKENRAG